MTSTLDRTPFRAALERVAASAELNLWVDRTLDPSAPVSPGPVGPTVYDCLTQIAKERDAVVFAIDRVALVGRSARVELAATALLNRKPPTDSDATLAGLTIQWERLSTPAEALQQAVGSHRALLVEPPLPHDLWPQVTWRSVPPPVAVALILAQFERRLNDPGWAPENGAGAVTISHEPLVGSKGRWDYRYKADAIDPAMRDVVLRVDPQATFRSAPNETRVRTTAAGHRLFTDALLRSLTTDAQPAVAANSVEALRSDPRRFTLRLINKPAQEVFTSLAATASVGVIIEPDAAAASRKSISLEAVELSLMELIEQVAALAELKIVWEENRFRVTP